MSTVDQLIGSLDKEEAKFVLTRNPALFAAYIFDYTLEEFQVEMLTTARENQRSLLLVPTKHGKSTLMSFVFPILEMCTNPNVRIILIMKNEDEAQSYAEAIRGTLQENHRLIEMFGTFYNPQSWASKKFNIAQRTITDPHYTLEIYGQGGKYLGHRCLTPGSLVVTSTGCKPIEQLRFGEFVLTHKGRFQRVRETTNRWTKEPIYRIGGVGVRQTAGMTADHKVYAWRNNRLDWFTAKELEIGDFLAFPLPRTNGSHRVFQQKDDQKEFDRLRSFPEFWRLYGYYVAEGNLTGTKKKPGYGVSLAFHEDEPWIDDVCAIARNVLGVEPHVHHRPETHTQSVVIRHKVFRRLAETCGRYAHQKTVPYWIKRTSVANQREFFLGYWRGDGCSYYTGGSHIVQITSASFDLLRDVQEMVSGWQITSNIAQMRKDGMTTFRGREIHQRDAWSWSSADRTLFSMLTQEPVTIPLKESRPRGFFIPGYRLVCIDSISIEDYDGPIYNIEVRNDHSYVLSDFTSKNCDLVICDDIVTEENSATREQREKLKSKFETSVQTGPQSKWTYRRSPQGWYESSKCLAVPPDVSWPRDINYERIVVCGTRFHPQDLYNKLEKDPTYKRLYFDCWKNQDETAPLWPGQWTKLGLDRERRSLGVLSFNKRYRNIAIDEGELAFRREWMRGGTLHDVEFPGCLDESRSFGDFDPKWFKVLGFDPASGSKTKWSSWPSFSVLGVDPEETPQKRYLIDIYRSQMGFDDILSVILDGNPNKGLPGFWKEYHYDLAKVEANSYGTWVLENDRMKEAQLEKGLVIQAHYTGRNRVDPETGVMSMGRMFMDGLVSIPYKTASDQVKAAEFLEEFELFPKGFYDLVMATWFAELGIRGRMVKTGSIRTAARTNSVIRPIHVHNPFYDKRVGTSVS
jgi:hypothetical protein